MTAALLAMPCGSAAADERVVLHVAVLGFGEIDVEPNTGEKFSELMRTELAALPCITILERERMEDLIESAGESISPCYDTECAIRLGRWLPVEGIVVGKVFELGDKVYLTAHLVDIEAGSNLSSAQAQCAPNMNDAVQAVTSVVAELGEAICGDGLHGQPGDGHGARLEMLDAGCAGEMIRVRAGRFTMGDGVAFCGESERDVTLEQDFYLGKHEVTNEEYLCALSWAHDNGFVTVMGSRVRDNLGGNPTELLNLDSGVSEIAFSDGVFSLSDAGHGINPDHPVKGVTWYGAAAYCDWLSMREGLESAYNHGDWSCGPDDVPYKAGGYRLPTDAEWEYAAQHDDERLYPWGDDTPSCTRANYSGCVGWTSPVGSYPAAPAALGLSDMAGNVWEWCNDWHLCSLRTSAISNPRGPGSGSYRTLRGGSWRSISKNLRCAGRNNRIAPSYSSSSCGFRVARTAVP